MLHPVFIIIFVQQELYQGWTVGFLLVLNREIIVIFVENDLLLRAASLEQEITLFYSYLPLLHSSGQ